MMRWQVALVALLAAGCSASGGLPSASTSPMTDSPLPASPSPALPSAPAARQDVTLAFGGDVHFAGRTNPRLTRNARDVLGPIGRTLAAADISMVNLESAVTERGTPERKRFLFRAPPSALTALRTEGVDVVSMANNHAIDYGLDGLRDSLAAARGGGVAVVGIGANETQAYAPHVVTVRGTRVAILAASQVLDSALADRWTAGAAKPGLASALRVDRLVAAVRAARARADVVVVYLHWGREGDECPTASARSLAGQLAAAGASAIVGSHAHTLVGDGWIGRTYVSYGLGNFLWYTSDVYPNSSETGVMTLRVRANRVVAAQLKPAEIDDDGVPQPAVGPLASEILTRFAALRGCARLSATPAP